MEFEKYLAAQEIADARQGYVTALTGETPEQAAVRLQKARTYQIPPAAVDAVTPEEEAQRTAQSVDWAAMRIRAPMLVQRMQDPAFATLVKDDLPAQDALETALWKLSPKPGTPTGMWSSMRNSFARGLYGFFNETSDLAALSERLNGLRDTEAAILEGKSDAELFGTEADPTGTVGRRMFDASKDAQKEAILMQMRSLSNQTAWSTRMRTLFPMSQGGVRFSQADGLSDSLRALAAAPGSVLADLGPESFAQFMPALALMPIVSPLGTGAQMAAAGTASFTVDKAASLMGEVSDAGVDMSDPEAVYEFFSNTANRDRIAGMRTDASMHAAGTALFDALSVGAAATSLVPRSLTRTVLDNAYKREFANLALQMPVQGAMGGAGEALGQYLSDEEISSWSDIVAEVIGEQFTAPVEILSTGVKARLDAEAVRVKAEQNAQAAQDAAAAMAGSKAAQLDPETVTEQMKRVTESSGVKTVTLDAQSFQQRGLDKRYADIPAIAEQLPAALATGGDIKVPLETYVTQVAPRDENGEVAALASFGDVPSVEESKIQAAETEEAVSREARAKMAEKEVERDFRAQVAAIGREVGKQIRKSGATKEEARSLQAVIQAYVAALARDAGMEPSTLWERHGADILGEPDVFRDETGAVGLNVAPDLANFTWDEVQYDQASPTWKGELKDFLHSEWDKGRYTQTTAVSENYSALTGADSAVEVILSRDAVRHALSRHENLTDSDFEKVMMFPSLAEGWFDVGESRVLFYAPRGDGTFLVAVVKRSVSEQRVRKGLTKERWNIVTLYTATTGELASTLRNTQNRKDRTSGGTRRTVPLTPFIGTSLRSFMDTLAQSPRNGNLAKGNYLPSLRVIARWKNADRSTLLHETAHLFLEMRVNLFRDVAYMAEENAENRLRFEKSIQGLLDWFGLKSVDEWFALPKEEKTKLHEKFARSFEGYVMEGRAPVSKLREAFRSFKRWLMNIYGILANIPEAELTDSVRELFDSMFLSEDQVRESIIRHNARPLFATVEDSGLSPVEWVDYKEALLAMVQDAQAEQSSRNVRAIRHIRATEKRILRELRKKSKGRYAEIRAEEEEKLKKTHAYRAWKVIRYGTKREGEPFHVKLYKDDLEMLGYGEADFEKLHKNHLATKQAFRQPMPLGDLARMLDYANANEMVDELLELADMTEYLDRRVAARMMAEDPTIATQERLQETADAALYNEARMKVLDLELKAMERQAGRQSRQETRAFEEIAYGVVSRMRYEDLRPRTFINAANRAARNARNAWIKGDMRAAIFFKRQEIYQSAMAKEAKETLMERAKAERSFRDFRKKEKSGLDTRFLVVIQRALVNMGYATREQMYLNPPDMTFGEELDRLADETRQSFDLADEAVSAIVLGERSYLDTVEGFRNFLDLVDQLNTRGRQELKIKLLGESVDLKSLEVKAARSIQQVADAHGRPWKIRTEETGKAAEFREKFERFGLNHARASALAAVLDGGWRGVMTDTLIYTADAAANREASLKNEFAVKLDKALSPVMARLRDTEAKRSEVFRLGVFTPQQVFVALLNYGNAGNRQRLLTTMEILTHHRLTHEFEVRDPETAAMVAQETDILMGDFFREYLTEEDFQAAEKVWAIFEDMRKETDKVARAINGRSPVWVQPRAFYIGDRLMQGGYYPIVYDRRMSVQANVIAGVDSVKDMSPLFGAGGVNDGHTKNRVKRFDHGLVLTPRAAFEGLEQQIHYVAWAQWVNDMRKVLNPKGAIAKAIAGHYGTQYFEALAAWVKDCRDGNRSSASVTDDIANFLRRNVSLAGIGFNFVTAAVQVVGATQSVAYLGGKWAGKGLAEFLRMGPKKSFEWVTAKSAMMRDRQRTQFREVTEIQSRLNGTTGELKDKFMRAAYMPLVWVQMLVDMPTWLGGYQRAIAEGASETRAIAEADRAVMNAQGSGRGSDLSRYERSGAWSKLFTTFYTFFNTALNLAAVSGKTKPMMKAAVDILMILCLQPVLETFLKAGARELFGAGDDDDDKWMQTTLKQAGTNVLSFNAGLLVGVRELSYLFGEFGYQGPAGLRKVTDTGRMFTSWQKAVEKGEVSEATLRATVSGIGVWAGWPVTPINRFISGASALESGETDNPVALLIGHSSK